MNKIILGSLISLILFSCNHPISQMKPVAEKLKEARLSFKANQSTNTFTLNVSGGAFIHFKHQKTNQNKFVQEAEIEIKGRLETSMTLKSDSDYLLEPRIAIPSETFDVSHLSICSNGSVHYVVNGDPTKKFNLGSVPIFVFSQESNLEAAFQAGNFTQGSPTGSEKQESCS